MRRIVYMACLFRGLAGSLITRVTDTPVASESSEASSLIWATLAGGIDEQQRCALPGEDGVGPCALLADRAQQGCIGMMCFLQVWTRAYCDAAACEVRFQSALVYVVGVLCCARVYRPDESMIEIMSVM